MFCCRWCIFLDSQSENIEKGFFGFLYGSSFSEIGNVLGPVTEEGSRAACRWMYSRPKTAGRVKTGSTVLAFRFKGSVQGLGLKAWGFGLDEDFACNVWGRGSGRYALHET